MKRVLLAGGGLANGLIAWRLHTLRPDIEVTVVEQGATLGGNHTWSFHEDDIGTAQMAWLRPLVAHEWSGQAVRFPDYERRMRAGYFSLTSSRLHEQLMTACGGRVRLNATIDELRSDGAVLSGGERMAADLVIDGRGAGPLPGFDLRWQKFLGLELDLGSDHGLDVPLLMDATVEQQDGYRFIYVLPLGLRRVLIEDTYYSDTPDIDAARLRRQVHAYAAGRNWSIDRVSREETGVLPIVLDGDPQRYWQEAGVEVARSGMRALLFHHTTGYSLPDAVRLAEIVAAAPELLTAPLAAAIREHSLARWRAQGYFRLLNRLMFEAARPAERYRTLQHFYRLGEPLIGRFYAGRLGLPDRLRVLVGKPPVPVGRALGCLLRSLGPRPATSPTASRRSA